MSEPSAGDIPEQFQSRAQQVEAATLGIWTFLSTEILFFGGLFLCYTVYRISYYAGFAEGSKELYYSIGTINTFLLMSSSFTMALGVHAIQNGHQKKLRHYVAATFSLGVAFLLLKMFEYYLDYRGHIEPSINFRPSDYVHPDAAELFFFFYYVMTLLHAVHMTLGLGGLMYLYVRASRGDFSADYNTPVEVIGLYWTFVDVVWVFLYPTLYLVSS
jgi:cytochrome c oxidase subunit 3